jgi:hypothetical protein
VVTITLPSELEKAVVQEAARKGTTAEELTLDVLQRRFLQEPPAEAEQSRAAASMQPMDLSEAEATALRKSLAAGTARPRIKPAPLPEYELPERKG